MAGFGSCHTRRRLRGLGISSFRVFSNASLFALAASRTFASILPGATRQHYYFCADSLGDCIQLRLAHMHLEELKIAAFYANNRETREAFTFLYTIAFSNKNLGH
jgi:hypothetical protein